METNPIKAVVFIKDEIKDTSEVNSIFSLPHEMKLDADYAKAKLIDSISDYTNIKALDEYNFHMNQRYNLYNTVACFYTMNALDLYRDNLYKFINLYLSNMANELSAYISQPSGILSIVKQYIDTSDSMDIHIISGDPSDPTFKLTFLKFEQASDAVIQLFTIEYINFINNIVNYIARDQYKLNEVYKTIYTMVYSDNLSNYASNFYQQVQFITCILREAAEQEIRLIRNGLSMISSNSTFMLAKQQYSMLLGSHKEDKPLISAKDYKDNITDIELLNNGGIK